MARTPSNTKLGPKQVRSVRGRGANYKYRALKLDAGNFSWGSEQITKRTRLLDVVYNATNNELVRTKTLVKNAIVHVDATPFKQYYTQNYDIELGKKKVTKETAATAAATTDAAGAPVAADAKKKSRHVQAAIKRKQTGRIIDAHVAEQFNAGRVLACITSRPGQSGRADGYILEGKELEFYVKKMEKRKK